MGGLERFELTIDQAAGLARSVRRRLVAYCLKFGYPNEAVALLRRIVADDPDSLDYRATLARALVQSNNLDEAERLSGALHSELPDRPRAIITRAEVLLSTGDEQAARDLLESAAIDPDTNSTFLVRLGEIALGRRDITRAREALYTALGLFEARKEHNPDREQAIPVNLWKALAEIADLPHFGQDLEKLRADEEAKIREMLAAPPRSERPRQTRTKLPPPPPPEFPRPRRCEKPPDASFDGAQDGLLGGAQDGLLGGAQDGLLGGAQDGLSRARRSSANPELEAELKRLFGFDQFRLGQQQVVEHVLAGRSVLAVMPTGAGKSLCYQLPAMMADGVTVVISPLIALMKDQVDGLPARVQAEATLINSTLEGDEIERRLREIVSGKYRLIYAAPERLRQTPFLHALRSRGVALFVVDETHCVSMWGHDFRPDYLFIGNALGYLNDPTLLAMTATATPQMRREIQDYFGRQLEVVSTGTHRPNLLLESIVARTQEEKMRELVRICKGSGGSGIVYTRSREKTETLALLLRRHGVRAAHYHAGLEDDQRSRVQEDFMDDRSRVICATVAFGMGIDKPDVRFVAHFSPPQSLENYYQEAGRAGRDGKPAQCALLYSSSDKAQVTRWTNAEAISMELPKQCYAYVRKITGRSPFAAVHVDDVAREIGGDETVVRVAIGLLERIGLLRRHRDVPATSTIGLIRQPAEGTEASRFVSDARLAMGQRLSFNTLQLCERTGAKPSDIENQLLEWRDQGIITYHGSGRTMLLERLPADRDARSKLEQLVASYRQAQLDRASLMFAYAETRKCRHDFIAEHFGEPEIEKCDSCDNCSGGRRPEVATSKHAVPAAPGLTNDQKRMKILETVRIIPAQVGFTGLVRVLKGSIQSGIKRDRCPNFGVLADDPKTAVERWVSELLENGHLVRDDGEYRLISLGPKGAAELGMR